MVTGKNINENVVEKWRSHDMCREVGLSWFFFFFFAVDWETVKKREKSMIKRMVRIINLVMHLWYQWIDPVHVFCHYLKNRDVLYGCNSTDVRALLHGAINCINTQLKLIKRAIDCSSLQFLVSQHVHKFIAQRCNFPLRCQRHDSLWAEKMCYEPAWTRISLQLLIII